MSLLKVIFSILTMFSLGINVFGAGGKWVPLKDLEVEYPLLVGGTYAKGHNITEPRPAESKYLKVKGAGIMLLENGAGFILLVELKERPDFEYYIAVEYPNPADPKNPLVNYLDYDPENSSFQFSSPDFVKGLKGYRSYTVTIRVYKDKTSQELVDTLRQPIRSYVDTQNENILIFKKVLSTLR